MMQVTCPRCGGTNEIVWDIAPGGGAAWEGDFADDVVRFRWHAGKRCPHFAYGGGVNSAKEVREFVSRPGAFRMERGGTP